MNERLTGILGLARRAGHLIAGFDAVKDALRSKRALLVLLAADISEKTEKELRFAAGESSPPIRSVTLGKEEIGHAIGPHRPVGVIAIDDRGFAAAVQKATNGFNEEDGI